MTDPQIQDAFGQALDWRLREAELDADGWRAFADWIDADPANAVALTRVDAADDAAGAVTIARPARLSPSPWRRLSWLSGGAAIAAGLALVVIVQPHIEPVTEIATRPGEVRTVAFGDGSHATLNGATLLRYRGSTPRTVELASGEAVFDVRHDADRPFRVTTRGYTIEDVGTVFNVVRIGRNVEVAVAEGSVTFEPKGIAIALNAGRALRIDPAATKATIRPVSVDGVGGWRTGLLNFDTERLVAVAEALERRSGARISLEAGLMDRPFTGSIRLSGNADRDVPHLAALIGADARYDGMQWILSKSH